MNHLFNSLVNVHLRLLRTRLPHKRSNPVYDITRSFSIAGDQLGRFAHLFEVGHVTREPAQAKLGVGHDGRKRLVISWAMEAVSSPIVLTRFMCARSACARRNLSRSSSACFLSLMSRIKAVNTRCPFLVSSPNETSTGNSCPFLRRPVSSVPCQLTCRWPVARYRLNPFSCSFRIDS